MRRFLKARPSGRTLLAVCFALLLAAPLVLLALNQRQEAITTALWYVIWLLNLVYRAVPQNAYWFLFLLVALVIAVASLIRREGPVQSTSLEEPDRPGRVQRLAQMVRGTDRSLYLRWQLARLLGGLTLDQMARRTTADEEARLKRISELETALSPEIVAYLKAGLDRWPYEQVGFRWRVRQLLRMSVPVGALDLDPEKVVLFLEDQGSPWEVSYDR
jgi:hypothetical protein